MSKYYSARLTLIASIVINTVAGQEIPQQYIDHGLSENLVLKEKKISLEKSLVALKEARSLFLPTTWFETEYTLAKGGRSIDLPVGDLLNPVYKTLNQLTASNEFPTISNKSEQLLPNNFYDARIKTTMPIINPDIRFNRDIKEQQTLIQQNEVDIYRRDLVKEIKTAYYIYLLSNESIRIYQNALQVVNENLRLNKSLLANGKGLPAYVSRAEAEVKQVESELQNAFNDRQNAKQYFNFLLNKPFTDSIISVQISLDQDIFPLTLDTKNVSEREELKSLDVSKNINAKVLKMNESFRVPRLNAFLDLASQGYDFTVNNKSLFYLGGVQMQIPVFSGKRNLYKIQQTKLDVEATELEIDNTRQRLELATSVSRNNAVSAYANFQASIKQQESSQKYFKLIDRGYREGVNNFIEFLDARNQLTNSELQVNINKYRTLVALVNFERQTASYSFK